MALFDRFRKSRPEAELASSKEVPAETVAEAPAEAATEVPVDSPSVPLERISYVIAYDILPYYAFNRWSNIEELMELSPGAVPAFFYKMACQSLGAPEIVADAQKYGFGTWRLDEATAFLFLAYPEPAVVCLDVSDIEKAMAASGTYILAPYFSMFVLPHGDVPAQYFILGQSPVGTTTFRTVTRDGGNINLGQGCEPNPNLFIKLVQSHLQNPRSAVAANYRRQ